MIFIAHRLVCAPSVTTNSQLRGILQEWCRETFCNLSCGPRELMLLHSAVHFTHRFLSEELLSHPLDLSFREERTLHCFDEMLAILGALTRKSQSACLAFVHMNLERPFSIKLLFGGVWHVECGLAFDQLKASFLGTCFTHLDFLGDRLYLLAELAEVLFVSNSLLLDSLRS